MKTELKSEIELNLTGSNDIIFKAIMLQHPNCLKAIMETLMNQKIKEIKILNSELPKRQFIEKGKRLDAYLESSDEYIDVEVSTSYNETTKNRNLSYVCHIYCNAIKKGENYSSYKKASIFNLVWREKGMKEGIQRNQREIINKLFSKGMTIIEIADMLDISQDTITSMLN